MSILLSVLYLRLYCTAVFDLLKAFWSAVRVLYFIRQLTGKREGVALRLCIFASSIYDFWPKYSKIYGPYIFIRFVNFDSILSHKSLGPDSQKYITAVLI